MAKLIITVDLDKKQRPALVELDDAGFVDELDYWIDFAYSDPPSVFDNATWEIVDEVAP